MVETIVDILVSVLALFDFVGVVFGASQEIFKVSAIDDVINSQRNTTVASKLIEENQLVVAPLDTIVDYLGPS